MVLLCGSYPELTYSFLRKWSGPSSLLLLLCLVLSFHSGGISIKPSANMDLMRADMGGAATICSAIVSAAKLSLPINVIGEWARGRVLESF